MTYDTACADLRASGSVALDALQDEAARPAFEELVFVFVAISEATPERLEAPDRAIPTANLV